MRDNNNINTICCSLGRSIFKKSKLVGEVEVTYNRRSVFGLIFQLITTLLRLQKERKNITMTVILGASRATDFRVVNEGEFCVSISLPW